MQFNKLIIGIFIVILSNKLLAETISIASEDGVKITADTYIIHEDPETPIIVLFHQASWSRGEYLEIAPKLNQLGFNCVAVDLRSGGEINGIPNETAIHAKQAKKQTRYIDALSDVLVSLRYINTYFPDSDIIAWGSSYSAALVLYVAGKHPDLIDGVLSFSPGEYFAKQGKFRNWIKESASSINVPVFITSARSEKNNWQSIFDNIPTKKKSSFLPKSRGNHGSKALWEQFDDNKAYWDAVNQFLTINFL